MIETSLHIKCIKYYENNFKLYFNNHDSQQIIIVYIRPTIGYIVIQCRVI